MCNTMPELSSDKHEMAVVARTRNLMQRSFQSMCIRCIGRYFSLFLHLVLLLLITVDAFVVVVVVVVTVGAFVAVVCPAGF
jgi:hypothetical protein